jgi:hypothetical protein
VFIIGQFHNCVFAIGNTMLPSANIPQRSVLFGSSENQFMMVNSDEKCGRHFPNLAAFGSYCS